MKLILRQLELTLSYSVEELLQAACHRLRCDSRQIKNIEVTRRSLDARPRRPAPVFIITAEVEMHDTFRLSTKLPRDVEINEGIEIARAFTPTHRLKQKPIVVGAGPAGLMAAYHLAMSGCQPILIERGECAENRRATVDAFWRDGTFNAENNVLFGEGGAGLFSDGKLTARSKDRPRIRTFFETLVKNGAPPDILIDAEPHLGSDVLLKVVANLRNAIEANGGEIFFNTTLTEIISNQNGITGIKCGKQQFSCDNLILATGHSARDIYRLLQQQQIELVAKPMAIGIRLEAPQQQINQSQYGRFATHPSLKAASFRVTRRPEHGARACYSFCMCPGGLVICCASEQNGLTTNGMSYSGRDSIWGNAAFIVPIEPADFVNNGDALSGLRFQESIEKAAFKAGGSDFSVPALMLDDFLAERVSTQLAENRSCQRSRPADFTAILPDFVVFTLRQSIPGMLRELGNVDPANCVVYAAETRSSSAVRIIRNEAGQSPSLRGLFPAGEGAGYAGGIVSSAVDGLKAAELLLTANP